MKNIIFWIVTIVTVFSSFAQDAPKGKIHGLVFGDYFYKASGDSTGNGSQYQNIHKEKSAFQFRWFRLFYDHNISDNFFAQFMLEGDDRTFDNGGRHSLFVKLAYLEWKNVVSNMNLRFGMITTPTWATAAKMWGYRSLEKTATDFRNMGAFSDIGIAANGKLGADGMFGYTVMIGNGSGPKPENDNSRKFYGAFSVKPIKNLVAEVNVDYEQGLKNKQNKFKLNKMNLIGFVGYQTEKYTAGLEVGQQTQSNVTDSTDVKPFAISLFGHYALSEKLKAVGRWDLYNPDQEVKKAGYTESFFLLGLDYMPVKDVHFIPNVWVNSFSKKKSTVASRDTDLVYRLTLFYVFK